MAAAKAGARELPLLQHGAQGLTAGSAVLSSGTSCGTAATASEECPGPGAPPTRHSAELHGQFNYEPPATRPLPPVVAWLQGRAFGLFLVTVFLGSVLLLVMHWIEDDDPKDKYLLGFLKCTPGFFRLFKYVSIPLVSIVFTWWHVWLGIQMCFFPVEFKGCCYPYLGWQGIVPRRARIMATRSCDLMIGHLITVEEIIDRIHPEDFFDKLEPVLSQTSAAVVGRLAQQHCPEIWQMLPEWCREELRKKVLEESRKMFTPVVADLKCNIAQIVDIKQMAQDFLIENKSLMEKMFLQIGKKEFIFIQHTSAVMGFILGLIQMLLWIILESGGSEENECKGMRGDFRCWGGLVILPVSGLVIGYFTNWLGITMIFRPVRPRIVCGGYVNIQGVFLKRQKQVSEELASMICSDLIHARRMLEYIVKRDDVVEKVLGMYQVHMNKSVDDIIGKTKLVLPIMVGAGAVEGIKQDVVRETFAELPNHSREIEAYMDRAFGLRDTMAHRLSRLDPERFEGMLHPVFQEDEWMVLTLGGILGVMVGALQALALGS